MKLLKLTMLIIDNFVNSDIFDSLGQFWNTILTYSKYKFPKNEQLTISVQKIIHKSHQLQRPPYIPYVSYCSKNVSPLRIIDTKKQKVFKNKQKRKKKKTKQATPHSPQMSCSTLQTGTSEIGVLCSKWWYIKNM